MRYLLEYARRNAVSRVIDQVTGFDIVHGVVVQLDPTWLSLWRLSRTLTASDWKDLDKQLERRVEFELHILPRPWFPSASWALQPAWMEISQSTPVQVDPNWSCLTWEAITRGDAGSRERPPFIINVLVAPRSAPGAVEELGSVLSESSERIRFEARSIARMHVNRKGPVRPLQGGISIGSDTGDYATLGGILTDSSGKKYGLTCGHAIRRKDNVKQPSPKDDPTATKIGVCVESTAGSLQGPVARCNRNLATNEVDAALIELDDDPQVASKLEVMSVGPLAGLAKIDDVYEDSPIEVSGRSGHKGLYTGGLFVIGSLLVGPDRFCFRNLMEVKRASVRNWGVTGTLARPVRPGDSGAWVIQDGPAGPEWSGMIVGGTGPIGYAVFAEVLQDWLKSVNYGSLSVA